MDVCCSRVCEGGSRPWTYQREPSLLECPILDCPFLPPDNISLFLHSTFFCSVCTSSPTSEFLLRRIQIWKILTKIWWQLDHEIEHTWRIMVLSVNEYFVVFLGETEGLIKIAYTPPLLLYARVPPNDRRGPRSALIAQDHTVPPTTPSLQAPCFTRTHINITNATTIATHYYEQLIKSSKFETTQSHFFPQCIQFLLFWSRTESLLSLGRDKR